jgi:DNA polymerase elongation subunit (family B)
MDKFYTNVFLIKDDILLRGYEDGKKIQYRIPYKPYLFIPAKGKNPSPYRTLDNRIVDKIEFGSIYEARDFVKRYEDVSGFEINGLTNYIYTFIYDNYPGEIKYDPRLVTTVGLDIEVSSEGGFANVRTANKEILALTMSKNRGEKIVLGYKDYTPKKDNITYFRCEDEVELIHRFLDIINGEFQPDIWTGWNIEFYDLPYLYNRICRLLGEKVANRMSPWGIVQKREVSTRFGKTDETVEIVGTTKLDYLNLYKKFAASMLPDAYKESYKLDDVAFHELKRRKKDYSAHGTSGTHTSLDELYKNDFEFFIDYNIEDVDLVDSLDDKLKFIDQVLTLSYDAKVNYNDSFTTVRLWDIIIHNYLLDKNIVVPAIKNKDKKVNIAGAYVKDPAIGLHNWVVSFDLNSLYPHLIMQYNISPETLVERIPRYADSGNVAKNVDLFLQGDLEESGIREKIIAKNQTIVPTGCVFDRTKRGFLPELMEKLYNDRVIYKKRMLDAQQRYEFDKSYEIEKEIAQNKNLQMARKIQLNGAYGALANEYFRFFNPWLAESVTISGQLSIRWIENKINEYLNKLLNNKEKKDYVLGVDTDGMYVGLEDLVKKTCQGKTTEETVDYLDKCCSKVFEPFIDTCYQELTTHVNAFEQKMKMKREVIANKGIWVAKKHYLLNVYNSEGVKYNEPKPKIVGLEAVKSSTPSSCRTSIKNSFKIILNGSEEELIEYIKKFREEFVKAPFREIAFPRGCNIDLKQYQDSAGIYRKGTPAHVKGVLLYNHYLREKKLEGIYPSVTSGDKIRFVYLKQPNPIRDTVISCPDNLPPELGLEDYIDHDIMFEKAFIEPLNSILSVIGWKTKKESTLEDLFA